MIRRRWLSVVLAAVVVLVVGAPSAAAHNALSSTSPAQGETVPRTPAEVVLTFDQPAIVMGTQVVVTGPSGPVQQEPPRLVDETVSQSLQPGAPAGTYTVVWRVTSSDGHPISGSYDFSSEAAGVGTPPAAALTPGASTAPAGPAGPSSTPTAPWVWWVGGAVVLIAGAAVLGLLRRRPVG